MKSIHHKMDSRLVLRRKQLCQPNKIQSDLNEIVQRRKALDDASNRIFDLVHIAVKASGSEGIDSATQYDMIDSDDLRIVSIEAKKGFND